MFGLTKSGTIRLSSSDLDNVAASALPAPLKVRRPQTLATDNELEHLFVTYEVPGQVGSTYAH